MISAPSEMRCRSMPVKLMTVNTAASTSGIDSATTAPARTPRLSRLTPSTMAIASHSASMKSSTACSTITVWLATSTGSMPTGRFSVIRAIASATLCPSAMTSPPLRMAMAMPMPCWPLTRNIGCAGSAGPRVTRAMSPRRIMRPPATKLMPRTSCSERKAPETRTRIFSSAGLHHARRRDGVLALERRDQRGAVDAQPGELLVRELDVHALVLGAQDVDLGDVRQLEQLLADVVHPVVQLALGEAVGREAVDDAVGVAELVVEVGADDALRQRAGDVAHLLAHLVPDVRHVGRPGRVLQVDEDRGAAGAGEALHVVEARRLLQLALQAVGDLLERVLDRGARPGRGHHHGLDGEVGILAAAELEVAGDARDHDHQHEEGHERAVPQGPFGKVEAFHQPSPSRRTFWPGRSICTPAVTTRSPFSRPCEMTTLAGS